MSIQWTQQTASGVNNWTSIASDSTGQFLVAVSSINPQTGSGDGNIYLSNDYGINWLEVTGGEFTYQTIWLSVTCSSNRQCIAAIGGLLGEYYIWTSSDSGLSWSKNTTYGGYIEWNAITSDSSGKYLAASTLYEYIWTSQDYGATWSTNMNSSTQQQWRAITSDSSGRYLAAATAGGFIYRSSNYGLTWTISQNGVGSTCNAITSDSTGQYLAATVNDGQGGNIWLSTNYGASWVNYGDENLDQNWTSIASNSNGNYLVACSEQLGGNGINSIWYSTDRGISWTQTNSDTTNQWKTIAINSSGQYIAVAGQNTYISTGYNQTACFNKGTNILCLVNKEEKYIPIEKLQKGDFVKTYKHGYKKIEKIGKGLMKNNVNKFTECMYKLKKTNANSLTEDLIVTGGHSMLVNNLKEEEIALYEKNNIFMWNTRKIENKYLLLAGLCDKFVQLKDNKEYTYYNFYVENDGDDDKCYGVWANGVLAETPSKNAFKKYEFSLK